MASSAARPKLSLSLGSRNTSLACSSSTNDSILPRNTTVATQAQLPGQRLHPRTFGPVADQQQHGRDRTRWTSAKMRTTSSTRLSGRKFETWMSTAGRSGPPGSRRPASDRPRPATGGASGVNRSVSTKFGITSMGTVVGHVQRS